MSDEWRDSLSMAELSDLSPARRLQLYRRLAADARRDAAAATGVTRECYILIAQNWEKMAAELNPRKRTDRRKKSRTLAERRN